MLNNVKINKNARRLHTLTNSSTTKLNMIALHTNLHRLKFQMLTEFYLLIIRTRMKGAWKSNVCIMSFTIDDFR
jgi:hypothetical protein